VSVDTNTKGKNLAPYRRHRLDNDLHILVSPKLSGMASVMRVGVTGGLRKKLEVELSDGSEGACEI